MPDSPHAVADAFAEAWNRADAEALTSVFTEDADFINVVGLWFRGHRQIRFNHAYGFEHMFPDTTMTWEKVSVRDLGGGAAVVVARWSMTGQIGPGGGRLGKRTGVITFVTARQSHGDWLAVSAQNTDIVPGAQTHTVEDGTLRPGNYE